MEPEQYDARYATLRGAWLVADGQRLPFADRSVDLVIGVTAPCFMAASADVAA